ncbi:MAG TPA: LysR family transcriptional regulator substrate-binding protein, partial [Chitinophagaceae bacterium]|nr:LysR family transcriptional regulator substrate-binding protein [Chitinophagaceae bacterium]
YTSYHWISPALVEFRKKYPGVDFKLEIEATSDTLSYLLNDKIDVGIFEDNKSNKAIYTPLFSDEFFVIVPARHKWASHKYLHAGQLSHEPYIMYDIPLEKSTISKLILKNISPSKVYKFPLTEVIFEMVKAGFGFTIMPNWVGLNYLKAKELKAIRISKNGIRRTWYAGVLKGKDIPPYVQSFIDMLVKQKAAVNT